jgi:hypothetical protein
LVAEFADGKIAVFLGPVELVAPDDLEAVIAEFIAGARRSLDVAVQELDSKPITQAILDARWRGVDVQMFLEHDCLPQRATRDTTDPARTGGGGDPGGGAGSGPVAGR